MLRAGTMLVGHDLVALLMGAVNAVVTTAGAAWILATMLRHEADRLPGWVNALCLLDGLGVGLAVWWATSR
jgi:hypothetical protein